MQGSAFIGTADLVMDRDLDSISPVCLDGRPRETTVDQQNARVDAVRRFEASFNCEVIRSGLACRRRVLVIVRIVCSISAPGESIRKWLRTRSTPIRSLSSNVLHYWSEMLQVETRSRFPAMWHLKLSGRPSCKSPASRLPFCTVVVRLDTMLGSNKIDLMRLLILTTIARRD